MPSAGHCRQRNGIAGARNPAGPLIYFRHHAAAAISAVAAVATPHTPAQASAREAGSMATVPVTVAPRR